MAKDKKSFLLYCDQLHLFSELTDEEAGRLIKHVFNYVNDLNPVAPDRLTQITFEPIKQQLKRDLKEWEQKSDRNREIANEAWKKRRDANAYESTKTDTKNTDNVNDNDNVTDNVNDKIKYRGFAHLSISVDEFNKLIIQGWNKGQIDTILDAIQNFKGNKKYSSLYLTALTWLKKDYPAKSVETKSIYRDLSNVEIK